MKKKKYEEIKEEIITKISNLIIRYSKRENKRAKKTLQEMIYTYIK